MIICCTDVSHQVFELSCRDLATSVFIQSSECQFDHLLILYWLQSALISALYLTNLFIAHLVRHHAAKLREGVKI